MATFQKNLSDPNITSSPTGGVVDNSTAAGIGGLSSILNTLGKINNKNNAAAARQANIDRQQANRAEDKAFKLAQGKGVGDATSNLLDLNDAKLNEQLQRRDLNNEVISLSKDGITPQEQKRIDAISKQVDKLSLLDPTRFALRKNALQKQALSDVSNLAIQPQINALFNSGVSSITEPKSDAKKELTDFMDKHYGIGNYNATDIAREQGKAIYLNNLNQQAKHNFTAIADQGSLAFSHISDASIRVLNNKIASQGFITEDDRNIYISSISSALRSAKNEVEQTVLGYRKQGRDLSVTGDVFGETGSGVDISGQAKKFMDDLNSSASSMLSLVKGEGALGDRIGAKQVLTDASTIVKKLNELKNPKLAAISTSIMGSGNGDMISMAANMLQSDDRVFQAAIDTLPPELQKNTSISDIKSSYAQILLAAHNAVDIKDAAEKGLVNPHVALLVSSDSLNKVTTTKDANSFIKSLELSKFNDVESVMDRLLQVSVINNIQNNKADILPIVRHIKDEIDNQLTDSERAALQVNKDTGALEIKSLTAQDRLKTSKFFLYTNKLLSKFNTLLDNYSGNLPDKQKFYGELLGNKQEGVVNNGQ